MAEPNVSSTGGAKPLWMQAAEKKDNAPQETEREKLLKTNVFDYAAQNCAFQG